MLSSKSDDPTAELNSLKNLSYLIGSDLFIVANLHHAVNTILLSEKPQYNIVVFQYDSGGARTHDLRRDRPAL